MTDIVDLIDNAIEDSWVSMDAMRWTPDLPETVEQTTVTVGLRRVPADTVWAQPGPVIGQILGVDEDAQGLRPRVGPPRRPVVDTDQPGSVLVPIVGGPWDGDLRAMPVPLRPAWNVPLPMRMTLDPEPLTAEMTYVTYELRNFAARLGPMPEVGLYRRWRGVAAMYVCGADFDSSEAAWRAMDQGWKPWQYPANIS